ncbi:MAG: ABC transporter permease [Gammaproteobacteria bacterium]|nr:ABC transporter permease [Gammaproteobacteria bacterium]
MRPLQRKLLRDLWRLKAQVLTIALVVASGVGGFIGSLSTHASLVSLRDAYYDSARFGHVFVAARRAPQRLEAAIRAIPGVVDVETTIAGNVMVTLPDTVESMTGRVVALPERGTPRINRVFLRSGRWLEPDDAHGVLVNEAFARARHLEPGSRVTLLVNGRFESLEVRGVALSPEYVFAAAHGGFADDTRFGVFWLSHAKLAAAYDMEGAFNSAALRLARGASVPRVIAALDRLLAAYGSRGTYAREDQPSNRALSQEIGEQQVFGTVLPAVFLAVAIFLLNVLLARHIATERLQIAALKALGYANRSIGLHYLALSLVIVGLGTLIGLGVGALLGQWMTQLYTGYFFFPVHAWHVEPWILAVAIGVAVLGAVGAAAGAVRAVVRLPPAEAMHPPAPAHFRRTLLERLHLGRLLPDEARMILRELERRKLRTALTVVGVASSVAIVIAGTWWGDAFDRLIDIELHRRERADVIVALTEAETPAALHAAARLPGVLAAEGSRDVPVRLRNGPYQYRTNVTGLAADARLRPMLDADLKPLLLVEGALLLTDRLARRLHVRPGDALWVEPLEGTGQPRLVPVALETGDLMGMRAYMTRRDAAALAGDSDNVNGIRLRIDRNRLGEFYERARSIPVFASIGDKVLMVRHFRATSRRNLLVFTGVLSAFAACIAVGVVYNSARIALAEHAWELASLRVLGFTRGEVSWILLGQVGLQILVAIPIGCLLGYGLAALLAELIHGEEFRIPLVILPRTYAFAILVMLGAALASAAIVRRRIDRLNLVAALKTRE